MRQFSIKELERFSDIKAHTIRTWENRYAVLKPERNSGNIRNYTLNDVKLLLNISLLTRNGFRISQLSHLTVEETDAKIRSLKDEQAQQEMTINSLIACMFSNDIDEFENCLDTCVADWGIDATIQQIIIPFLEKVEILSYKDNSIEVHFAVTAVRKKLISGIEQVKRAPKTAKSALLFLPKGEHYDLLLLYLTYFLKKKGLRILYLGTNVSYENLEKALIEKKPDQIYTYLPSRHSYDPQGLIGFLKQNLPETSLHIAEEDEILHKNNQTNVYYFHFKTLLS